MKQQGNSLPLDIQKAGIPDSRMLVFVWTGLIVILVLVSGYEYYPLIELKNTLSDLDIKKGRTQETLDKLSATLPGNDETEFLISEITRLESEVKTKKGVISQLSGRAIGNTVGFSGYLEGFAKQIRNGIWIRKISITDGGANLHIYGSALSPGLVPQFLKDLSNEQVFSDTEFKSFIMDRPGNGNEEISQRIDFSIQTSVPEEYANATRKDKSHIDRAHADPGTLTDTGPVPQPGGKEAMN